MTFSLSSDACLQADRIFPTWRGYTPQAQVHQDTSCEMCCRPAGFSAEPSAPVPLLSEHMGHQAEHKWKQGNSPSAARNRELSRDTTPSKSLRLFCLPKECAESPGVPGPVSCPRSEEQLASCDLQVKAICHFHGHTGLHHWDFSPFSGTFIFFFFFPFTFVVTAQKWGMWECVFPFPPGAVAWWTWHC